MGITRVITPRGPYSASACCRSRSRSPKHTSTPRAIAATLDTVSVELATRTVLVTRNSVTLHAIGSSGEYAQSLGESGPIGLGRHTRPPIDHFSFEKGLYFVLFTVGIAGAGARVGASLDPRVYLNETHSVAASANDIADGLLAAAIAGDDGRPRDDTTVAALRISEASDAQPIRRVRFGLPVLL